MKTKDIRWIQRFNSYSKVLAQLSKFIEKSYLTDFEEQGLIKSFEYTHELAWKTLKDFFEYQGDQEIHGSRDATRKAFKEGLMDEDGEIWMDMIQSRNMTSHTYNEKLAGEISTAIVDIYYPAFVTLRKKLKKLAEEETK